MHRNETANRVDEYLLGKIALQHTKSSSRSTCVSDSEFQRPSGLEEFAESYDAKNRLCTSLPAASICLQDILNGLEAVLDVIVLFPSC